MHGAIADLSYNIRHRARRSRSTYWIHLAIHLALRTDEMFCSLPHMNREFGRRLHHDTPLWVPHDVVFHIRIRCAEDNRFR